MSLVDSVKQNKADYNTAIDAVVMTINATRVTTNASFDATIEQLTKVAVDFPASIVAPPA